MWVSSTQRQAKQISNRRQCDDAARARHQVHGWSWAEHPFTGWAVTGLLSAELGFTGLMLAQLARGGRSWTGLHGQSWAQHPGTHEQFPMKVGFDSWPLISHARQVVALPLSRRRGKAEEVALKQQVTEVARDFNIDHGQLKAAYDTIVANIQAAAVQAAYDAAQTAQEVEQEAADVQRQANENRYYDQFRDTGGDFTRAEPAVRTIGKSRRGVTVGSLNKFLRKKKKKGADEEDRDDITQIFHNTRF